MRTAAGRPIEACLLDLFRHLGVEQAHIAAGGPPPLMDWHSLATLHPERVASLTLISPPILDTAPLAGLASRILVVAGDRGALTPGAAKFANSLPNASAHILRDYDWQPWSDVIADRGVEIGAAMLDFLDRHPLPAVRLSVPEGEAAGISYRICGAVPMGSADLDIERAVLHDQPRRATPRRRRHPRRARPIELPRFSTQCFGQRRDQAGRGGARNRRWVGGCCPRDRPPDRRC
jgi:pimeloyl-ACP methyl ester carboxylesterase